MRQGIVAGAVCVFSLAAAPAGMRPAAAGSPVTVLTAAEGGIQPQAAVDRNGVVHVVYFAGDPAGGDLFYVRLSAKDGRWGRTGTPERVNSVSGSALASGSVRGAQLSLGRDGHVHVAWHGAKPVAARGASRVPMWYTRTTSERGAFEPQRVVSGDVADLDGGTVAADAAGHVVVAWHGRGTGTGDGNRTAYVARSSDDGKSFAAPERATSAPIGACGCCGMRAQFDSRGVLHLLYRAATGGTHRDTMWVMMRDGSSPPPVRVHPWELETCPMSTYALAAAGDGMAAAWETAQQIYSATLNPVTGVVSAPQAVPGSGSRKHPSIAVNAAGDRLLAWTEGTAWKRGGTVAWRLTSSAGAELASAATAGPVPVWGLVSAVALPDGSFLVLR